MKGWSLGADLRRRDAQHLLRRRQTLQSPQGRQVEIGGRSLLAFCSNDYLGLANHPEVKDALVEGIARFGAGAGASHLVSGHFEAHQALELALARHTGRERALLFGSGFQANLGIMAALLGKEDQVFQDRLNHASLLDGGLLSGARSRRYQHADPVSLQGFLERASGRRVLVASDGVFSMDGDIAPLDALAALCDRFGACLLVDDAHGFGVLGECGAGSIEHFQLSPRAVPLLMGTLGKSLGLMGAFVAGDEDLMETILQGARSYIYTTALPPAYAHACLTALTLMRDSGLRASLHRNISHFRQGAQRLQLRVLPSQTAIQPLMLGDSEQALRCSERLRSEGLLVPAIRPPTVPRGTARLRIALSAAHTTSDIDQLLDALGRSTEARVA